MVKDAEAHAAEDKKRKALVEARNQAEALIHSAEKQLSESGDKVAAADKSAVEAAVADLKSVKDGEDVEAIEAKINALTQAVMKVGEALYKAGQAAGEAGDGQAAGGDAAGESAGGSGDDKVVDADFEEVDERKGKSA
jgi:molecular chaperone DnaK